MMTGMRSALLAFAVVAAALPGLASCGAEGFSLGSIDAGATDGGQPLTDLPVEPMEEAGPGALLAIGATCAAAPDCDSGFCVDGVCCQDACAGLCVSCALPGKRGTCSPQAMASDPDNDCEDQGMPSCGQNGMCDGAGKCQLYPAATACAAPVCNAGMFTPGGQCDGQGACRKPAATTCGNFQCQDATACKTTCAADADCRPPNHCFSTACGGVVAQYFGMMNLTNPVLMRVDPNIDFDWGAGSPGAGVPADLFSARWTGLLTPRFSELYTFYTASSDGARVFLDDTPVIDAFVDQMATMERMGTRTLEAGKAYQLRVEYYERYSVASIKLSWSSPSQPKAVIPTTALSPM
jgi:PA14 domain